MTDGRMSGASGKVPAAIHVSPEALDDGAIAKLRDGDLVLVDGEKGTLEILTDGVLERPSEIINLDANNVGSGRELFQNFRKIVTSADSGASVFGVE